VRPDLRTTFVRTLLVISVIQFAITRHLAGQTVEEGRAERMWMLYPFNVILNALAWTLLLSASARAVRLVRRLV
jgi:hypothetical protein